MKTYMFPGQGSQARGMGGALFDEYADLTRQADEILGYSIRTLCMEDPRGELSRTQFTQPALYVVNALAWQRALAKDGPPDFVAGHSLGEFNALLAAGCFDFATGLQLVRKRGELMAQAAAGSMAAILNGSKDQIEAVLRDNGLSNIDLANYNSPTQIVISGAQDEVARAAAFFGGDMMFVPLNTSGAFHSRFMRPAQLEFEAYLQAFEFAEPSLPVIANVTARPYEPGSVRDNLSRQIASTVRWSETVQYLLGVAVGQGREMSFHEIGHGDVLTKLARSIRLQTPKVAAAPAAAPAAPAPVSTAAPARAAAPADRGSGGAEGKVHEWNRRHPVGSRVRSTMPGYGDLETRTEAVVLFGHRAAVYMKGYNGYFDLDEVRPL